MNTSQYWKAISRLGRNNYLVDKILSAVAQLGEARLGRNPIDIGPGPRGPLLGHRAGRRRRLL